MFKLLSILVLVHAVFSKPQFITFKDGKIGVNFGGYHAEAGLGGLLTGNAAHGGLSASAGTPFGQEAGAGIGGSLDGRTAGGAYAGASAGYGVGASAAIGGGLGENGIHHGGIGAESHIGGMSKKVVKLSQSDVQAVNKVTIIGEKPPAIQSTYSQTFAVDSTLGTKSLNDDLDNVENIDSSQDIDQIQTFKKHYRPNTVLYSQKHFQLPQFSTQTQTQINTHKYTPLSNGFNYRNFFDFGFFSNTAAGFGGYHGNVQTKPHTVLVEKTITKPQVVYEKRVVPKVVYEKRIVPQVIIEKKIIPHTVVVQETVQPPAITTSVHKEIQVGKTVDTGLTTGSQVSYFGGAQGSKFFDDIFNIPISSLQAVNKFVSNTASQGHGVSVQKNVEVYKK